MPIQALNDMASVRYTRVNLCLVSFGIYQAHTVIVPNSPIVGIMLKGWVYFRYKGDMVYGARRRT